MRGLIANLSPNVALGFSHCPGINFGIQESTAYHQFTLSPFAVKSMPTQSDSLNIIDLHPFRSLAASTTSYKVKLDMGKKTKRIVSVAFVSLSYCLINHYFMLFNDIA